MSDSGIKLKFCADLVTTVETPERRPFVALEHLEGRRGRFVDGAELPLKSADSSGTASVEAGDVLFGKLGPHLAKSILVDRPLFASSELLALRPRSDLLDSRYLAYIVQSRPFVAWAVARSHGAMFPRTSWEAVGRFTLVLPSLTEQRRIADRLDDHTTRIDSLIHKKRQLISLASERRDRRLDSVALPLRRANRRVPTDVPLAEELPAGWNAVPISLLLKRITYGFTNPMPTSDVGPFMLTASDISDGEISYETARRTTQEAFEQELTDKSRPRRGDILLTKDGTLGRCALYDGPLACVNQSVAVLSPRPESVKPELLARLLTVPAYRDALLFEAGGTTIKHLYITRIVKQKVGLPPTGDHDRLAHELEDVHDWFRRTSNAIGKQVNLLLEHRETLITAAVCSHVGVARAVS